MVGKEAERLILTVDRDLEMRDIIQITLEERGIDRSRLLFASGIKEAQQQLDDHSFDLIILSLDLIDGHGLDFLKKLRGERDYKGSLMIITEDDRPGMKKACEEFELDGYFPKPLLNLGEFGDKVLGSLNKNKQ